MTTTLDPITAAKTVRDEYDRLDTLVMGLVDLLGDVQNHKHAVKLPELRHATAQALTRSMDARDAALDTLLRMLAGRAYDASLTEVLTLSARTHSVLARNDIRMLTELESAFTTGRIADLDGVGQKTLDEIEATVEEWAAQTEGAVA